MRTQDRNRLRRAQWCIGEAMRLINEIPVKELDSREQLMGLFHVYEGLNLWKAEIGKLLGAEDKPMEEEEGL